MNASVLCDCVLCRKAQFFFLPSPKIKTTRLCVLILQSLKSLNPQVDYFSIRNDILGFVESHWSIISNLPLFKKNNWKKSLLDSLNHCKQIRSGKGLFHDRGYYCLVGKSNSHECSNSSVESHSEPVVQSNVQPYVESYVESNSQPCVESYSQPIVEFVDNNAIEVQNELNTSIFNVLMSINNSYQLASNFINDPLYYEHLQYLEMHYNALAPFCVY
ncbi:Uncharacterized protein QTN25_007603 [Entamoeba marina]